MHIGFVRVKLSFNIILGFARINIRLNNRYIEKVGFISPNFDLDWAYFEELE